MVDGGRGMPALPGHRAALLIAVAALAGVVLSACASPGSHSAAGSRPTSATTASTPNPAPTSPVVPDRATTTIQHVFAAFDPSGAPTAGVTAHRSGSCFTSSITVASRSAFRCVAGNRLLDPCFVVPGSSRRTVDCYADPWHGAVRLALTKTVPKPGAPLKITDPWALQLAGGTRCVVTTGTSRLLHGVAMRYQCGGGSTAGLRKASGSHLVALEHEHSGVVRRVAVSATWTA